MSMTSVHVYMPAVKLYRLCCICQVYIYIFRVFSCLCSVRRCICYECKYLQDVNVYISCVYVYMRSVYMCIFRRVVV